jgi:hypothetical protein
MMYKSELGITKLGVFYDIEILQHKINKEIMARKEALKVGTNLMKEVRKCQK